ncbi:MAG: DoxX family membrane protein [Alphaproteobacteria bacterium]|nr:DoxX family membrane protein [Alphaproteobacteria bacterium]
MKNCIGNLGFSIFRISIASSLALSGYGKVMSFFTSGKVGVVNSFVNKFHGAESTVPGYISIFFPKFILIPFGWLTPFWELIPGVLLVLGICRKPMAVLLAILILIFAVGSSASGAPKDQSIWMFLNIMAYVMVWLGIHFNLPDPLAIDNYICKGKKESK